MYIDFEEFKNKLLYHRIVKWNRDEIVLDNGIQIFIRETESDWCASAAGGFSEVKLDAAITSISDIKYAPWDDDGGTYGCSAMVKFLHNRTLICKAEANADAGNGGYYYSIASFILYEKDDEYVCTFVSSEDKYDER